MSNSSWAYNFAWADGERGQSVGAPDKERFMLVTRSRDKPDRELPAYLPEAEVKKLVSAMQSWLGELADKRGEEEAKKKVGDK